MSNIPNSPFDPFEPSPRSAEFRAQLFTGEEKEEYFFEAATHLAPMPDAPPPPPPLTPPREAGGTIVRLPESRKESVNIPPTTSNKQQMTSPRLEPERVPPVQMPEHLPPPIPPSKRKNKKSKKKKKDKKNKLHKITSNGGGGGGKSYAQYNAISPSASPSSNDQNIVHYNADNGEETSYLTTIAQSFHRRKVNTGELNSAAGEGTTVPQILSRIRLMTYVLSGLTISFEAYAMFFNILLLQADKFVLGFYLLFFVALLLLFEIVRGDPVPAANMFYNRNGANPFGNVNVNVNVNINNAAEVADIVWKMVLEKRWARQIRYFLQNNVGILYSCTGRGVYLCFVGSVALGQGFFLIEILGAGFMLMGLWTIFLSFRFPALEKALIMDLEGEFGERDDEVSVNSGSAVTWSSVRSHSSAKGEEHKSLLQR